MAHAPASQKTLVSALPLRYLSAELPPGSRDDAIEKTECYVTLRSATMPYGILSFGSWLEPRYIFAAGQLKLDQ